MNYYLTDLLPYPKQQALNLWLYDSYQPKLFSISSSGEADFGSNLGNIHWELQMCIVLFK